MSDVVNYEQDMLTQANIRPRGEIAALRSQ